MEKTEHVATPILKDVPVPNIIRFICDEVTRQGHNIETLDGFQRVAWMATAWEYAMRHTDYSLLAEAHVIAIGQRVEVGRNARGYRKVGVRVGDRVCPPWEEVPSLMNQLFRDIPKLTPEEFYKLFLLVHPFADGNGRVGKVLYSWLRGELSDPKLPPNFFNCANP